MEACGVRAGVVVEPAVPPSTEREGLRAAGGDVITAGGEVTAGGGATGAAGGEVMAGGEVTTVFV